jgi:hypothetical protein
MIQICTISDLFYLLPEQICKCIKSRVLIMIIEVFMLQLTTVTTTIIKIFQSNQNQVYIIYNI